MPSVVNRIKITLLCIVICQPVFSTVFAQNRGVEKFLSVSDIHFDPFSTCKAWSLKACPIITQLRKADSQSWERIFTQSDSKNVVSYGNNTNYALLKSSLAKLKEVSEKEDPRFILILGDFLPHNMRAKYILYSRDRTSAGYRDFVKKTLQFLTLQIRQALPKGDIYPAVGNNDSYTGDYGVVPNGDFFSDLRQIWMPFIQNKQNRMSFVRYFPSGGYYAVDVPNHKNQRIIVLNTVLFSVAARGQAVKQAALEQLTWLHKQLSVAAKQHQSVILAFHIPIGVNVYATLKSIGQIKEFWKQEYNTIFEKELAEYSHVIVAILPGHIHMDGFQLAVFSPPRNIPVSFTPSISPVYGNNPGFKLYSYDSASLQLKNFKTYFYPLNSHIAPPSWREEYNFKQLYEASRDSTNLNKGIKEMADEGTLASYYQKYYSVGSRFEQIKQYPNWLLYYWCNLYLISARDYQQCIKQQKETSKRSR